MASAKLDENESEASVEPGKFFFRRDYRCLFGIGRASECSNVWRDVRVKWWIVRWGNWKFGFMSGSYNSDALPSLAATSRTKLGFSTVAPRATD